jgi:hypothetical protein
MANEIKKLDAMKASIEQLRDEIKGSVRNNLELFGRKCAAGSFIFMSSQPQHSRAM